MDEPLAGALLIRDDETIPADGANLAGNYDISRFSRAAAQDPAGVAA